MKKTKFLMPIMGLAGIASAIAPLGALTSCNKNKKAEKATYTVTFDYNDIEGTEPPLEVAVKEGNKVEKPEDPTYGGFKFTGWFLDRRTTKPFDFNTAITKSITVYAGWEYVGVESISIKTQPKVEYFQGEQLDLNGMVVQAILNDKTLIEEVPIGYYTTEPAQGTVLNEIGDTQVTVTVGDKITTFVVNVKPAVVSLEVDTYLDLTDMVVGQKISRSDFLVTAYFSDHTSRYVDDWTSNVFEEGEDTYTVNKAGEQKFIFYYGKGQAVKTGYAVYDGDFSINTPMEMTLPVYVDGGEEQSELGFSVKKQLTVLNNGVRINNEEFKEQGISFTIDDNGRGCARVDEKGIIKTLATTDEGPALIHVKHNNVDVMEPIKLRIFNVSIEQAQWLKSKISKFGQFIDYNIYLMNDYHDCIIPDYVTYTEYDFLGRETEYDYKITLEAPEQSNVVDDMYNLYLPRNLYEIWKSQITFAKNLQNIYFDGLEDELSKVRIYSDWTNNFVTGVQCLDKFLPVSSNHLKADLDYFKHGEEGYCLALKTPTITEGSGKTVTMQFDMSNYIRPESNEDESYLTGQIQLVGIEPGATFDVYANGIELDKDFDYEYETDTKLLKIVKSEKLKQNIVVKISGSFAKDSFAFMKVNGAEKIQVRSARHSYSVGDTFMISSLHVEIVFSDKTKYEIKNPGELLTLELCKSDGTVIRELKNGDEFQDSDVEAKKVKVTFGFFEELVALTTEYDISIKA